MAIKRLSGVIVAPRPPNSGIPGFWRWRPGGQKGLADGAYLFVETVVTLAIGHDADTGTEGERSVRHAQDIGKADVLGRPAQRIAALAAAMAAHDASLF